MSAKLRWDQCCNVIHKGQRCTRPATELGGLCGAHWRGANPSTRDYLTWEATWQIDIPEPHADATPLSAWDICRAADAMLGD